MSKPILGAIEIVAGAVLDYFSFGTAGNWLISMGLATELGAAVDALTGPKKPPVNPIGVAYSGTLEPRRIIYGQVKLSGIYVIPPMTSGGNNDDFHLILALAGRPVTSIGDVYLDQIRIPSSYIGAVTGASTDGVVLGIPAPPSGTVNGNAYNNLVHLRRYDGTQTAVDYILNTTFSVWDSTHIGKNIPYIAAQFHFSTSVFPSGPPQITAMVKGHAVYDPRLDSTNGGSGSQRATVSSTWTYSTNPALILRDYLTSALGLGEAQTRIDDTLVAAAASICDGTVTVPIPILPGLTNWTSGSAIVGGINTLMLRDLNNGNFTLVSGNFIPTVATYVLAPNGSMLQVASVQSDVQLTLTATYPGSTIGSQITQWNNSTSTTTTQPRYTCSTVLDCTARFESNIQTLATAMMGRCIYSAGKWRMFAGAWSGSAFTLTENDLVGSVNIQCNTPRRDLWNAVRGNFIDPSQNYQPNEFPAILNSSYETQDGERIYTETSFVCCGSTFEAQRNAMILSRQSRDRHIVVAQYGMSAFRVKLWETGTVTLAEIGWINQSVRCIGWKFQPKGVVELTLQEAYSADWTDPLIGAYVTNGTNVGNLALQYVPYPPTGLTTTSIPSGITFNVTLPGQSLPGTRIELWEYTANTPFSSATRLCVADTSIFTIGKRDTITRYYWVRTIGGNNIVSTTFPTGNGIAGAADQVQTPDIANAAVSQIVSATRASTSSYSFQSGIADADDLTVSITTTGNPIGIDVTFELEVAATGGTFASPMAATITRGGTAVGTASINIYDYVTNTTPIGSPAALWTVQQTLTVMDAPAAGTYTYALHLHAAQAGGGTVHNLGTVNPVLKVREYKK
jgi:hypothetical protein